MSGQLLDLTGEAARPEVKSAPRPPCTVRLSDGARCHDVVHWDAVIECESGHVGMGLACDRHREEAAMGVPVHGRGCGAQIWLKFATPYA